MSTPKHSKNVVEPDASAAVPPTLDGQPWPRRWLLRHADPAWGQHLKKLDGEIVHVMRNASFVQYWMLDHLIRRANLPLLAFVNLLTPGWVEPGRTKQGLTKRETKKVSRRWRLFRNEEKLARGLVHCLDSGRSALLFVRASSRIRHKQSDDPLRALITRQRQQSRPIFLIPQTMVWVLQNRKQDRNWLWPNAEFPNRVRDLLQMLFRREHAQFKTGDAINLKAFSADHANLSDEALANRLRYALVRRIESERFAVAGPERKTGQRLIEEILRSPRTKALLRADAESKTAGAESNKKKAHKILKTMAAAPTPWALYFLDSILKRVFPRIFDAMDVDDVQLNTLRSASRDSTLVFLPNHRSHADYLVVSHLLKHRGLPVPMIAAGNNLRFWPAGPILRRAGAFFIKRAFRGDALYTGLVSAYIRKLLNEGYPLEFFIEGGRSRTGHLLRPKLGLLSMVAEAASNLPTRKITLVPISITYERVVEQSAYAQELSGAKKKRESMAELMKNFGVLRSRYGRVYVRFGQLIPLSEFVRDHRDALKPSGANRARAVRALASKIIDHIHDASPITPTNIVATALLSGGDHALSKRALMQRVRTFVALLSETEIPGLDSDGSLSAGVVKTAVERFAQTRLVTLSPELSSADPDEYRCHIITTARIELEYYKNAVLRSLYPAWCVAAELAAGESPDHRGTIDQELLDIVERELNLTEKLDAEATWQQGVAQLRQADVMHPQRDGTKRANAVSTLRYLMQSYLEARVVFLTLLITDNPIDSKHWQKRTLRLGQRMYLTGEIVLRETLYASKLQSAKTWARQRALWQTSGNMMKPDIEKIKPVLIQLKEYIRS